MAKYVIALVDMNFGYPPVFYAEFEDCVGTTPKREQALVVEESEVDKYLEKAQKLSNKMEEDAFLPVEFARKAVKWSALD